jgi:hypothetical protein
MTKSRIIANVLAALLIGGAVAAVAIIWRPAIAAINPPEPQSFDDTRITSIDWQTYPILRENGCAICR